ncbi:MAG: aldose 1-epimerase family protein [Anaerolineae bacterium]
MVMLDGREYTREELLSYVSDLSQVGGVRLCTLDDGSERGVRMAEFRTGSGFAFDVLLDRGMDIGRAEHKGRALAWRSAAGTPHPAHYGPGIERFRRFFHGGLMAGCGLENVGSPGEDEGEALPADVRLSATPASHVSYGGEWRGDEHILWVEGQMRQAVLFGSNLLLKRRVWAELGGDTLHIEDAIENQGQHEAPYQILYHCNFGYPLLSPDAGLLIDSEVWARDQDAEQGLESWSSFHEPVADYPEQVFYHRPYSDDEGYGSAALINPTLGMGVVVRFRLAELPHLVQWKMMERGTYVLGLEPANCWVEGRAVDRQRGILRTLEPGERVELQLDIQVLPNDKVIGVYTGAGRGPS